MWLALLLFVAGVVQDAIWALYIIHTGQKNKVRSAFYSVGIGLGSIIMVTGMLGDEKWLMVFWLIGLWIGTYYAQAIEQQIGKIYEQISTRITGRR